ncbi:MAG: ABC transporter permease, partial [Gemmatimonadetes bacterium]|nr:ABC transporter permease [Gemmatimonadota bacterium]
MPRIRPGIARLFRLRPRSDEDLARELDEEIEAHVALRAAQLEERGLSTEEAHAEARRRFDSEGDAKRALLAAARARRETHPPRRLGRVMDDLRQDVRLWLRRIRRQPAFSATACLTLSLGIGATTAIFSVIDSILLEPLPYHDPGRLVSVGHEVTGDDPQTVGLSTGAYFVYRESDAFEHLAVYATDGLNLSGAEGPVRVSATSVNHAFFPALGTVPLLGRGFTEADDEPGASPVVILGHGAWRRLFGADLDIVGQTVLVNALEAEVVGVLPADFRFEARSPLRGVEAETELWLPFGLDPARARNINFSLQAFARLAPGV